jgi:hypothetical protein
MPSKLQQQQQQQDLQQSPMTGGDGAAAYALQVYGDGNQQHAISDIDNRIAVTPLASCSTTTPAMKGGDGRKALQQLLDQKMQEMQQHQGSQEGGFLEQLSNLVNMFNKNKLSENDMNNAIAMTGGSGVLENIAVPAILLYLNQRIGKKSSHKKQKSMKLRRGSRMSRRYRK